MNNETVLKYVKFLKGYCLSIDSCDECLFRPNSALWFCEVDGFFSLIPYLEGNSPLITITDGHKEALNTCVEKVINETDFEMA